MTRKIGPLVKAQAESAASKQSAASTTGPRIVVRQNMNKILPDKPRSAEYMCAHGLGYVLEAMRKAMLGCSQWPFVLQGEPGSGKSCAALIMLDGVGGRYWTLTELCEELAEAKCGAFAFQNVRYFWKGYKGANFVVIDEIATEARDERDISPHHAECLHRLLDKREGQPLLLITNRTIKDILRLYGDPIASRMNAGTCLEFTGDRRQRE